MNQTFLQPPINNQHCLFIQHSQEQDLLSFCIVTYYAYFTGTIQPDINPKYNPKENFYHLSDFSICTANSFYDEVWFTPDSSGKNCSNFVTSFRNNDENSALEGKIYVLTRIVEYIRFFETNFENELLKNGMPQNV